MRIERIDLRKYGHFENQTLDVAESAGKLLLVYGLNETGKTTTLDAVRHWLYGFPAQKGWHSADAMVGGSLSGAAELECLRTRGRKTPLVAADGKTAVPEQELKALLGDITQDRFENFFGLSHEVLREGGREIAEGKGHLGEALFAAASGLNQLRRLRGKIAEQRVAIYLPAGKNPPLNSTRREYEDAKKRVKDEQVSAADVAKFAKEAADAKSAEQALQRQRDAEKASLEGLKQVAAARPHLARRQELQARLESMQAVPTLRSDFGTEWKPIPETLAGQRKLLENHTADIRRLEVALAELPGEDAILLHGETIDALHARFEERTQAHDEKIAAEQLVRAKEGEAKQALRQIGLKPEDFEEHVATLVVSALDAEHLRELADERITIDVDERNAQRALQEAHQELKDAQAELAALPPAARRDSLEQLHARLAEGDPLKAYQRLEVEIDQTESEFSDRLKRLGISASWPEAAQWPLPTPTALREYERRFQQADQEGRDRVRELSEAQKALRTAEKALASAELAGAVHVLADWDLAKARRDATWSAIGAVWLEGEVASEPPAQLAARFAREVHGADEVADRLRRDAEKVALKTQAQLHCEQATAAIQDRLAARAEHAARVESERTQWQALWATWKIEPQSPTAMLEWLGEWSKFVETAQLQSKRFAQRVHAIRERDEFLRAAQAELGDVAPVDVAILIRKRQVEADKLHGQRIGYEKNLANRQTALSAKQKREQEASQARDSWEQRWRLALSRLPKSAPRDLDPPTTLEWIAGILRFREHLDFRHREKLKVNKLQKTLAAWNAQFDHVARHLGEPHADDHPAERVAGWKTRLEAARKADQQRQNLSQQLQAQREKFSKAEAELARLSARAQTLQKEAGAAALDGVADILRQAEEKRTLTERVETDCDAPLRRLAAGIALAELATRVEAHHGTDLNGPIAEAQAKIESLEKERDEAVRRGAEAEAQLKQLHAKQGGRAARADLESALARMRNLVPDYVVAVLAEKVLEAAVQRYQERNQSELFGSAAAYFRQLTCKSFDDLVLDENEKGQAILVGVRPSGRVLVDGMSEGTRDQLYLALRLAHLDKHIRDHGPFPILLDDVLLAFDDVRALAALACLVELSAKTQVILFTHHAHIRTLVLNSPFRERVALCELGAPILSGTHAAFQYAAHWLL